MVRHIWPPKFRLCLQVKMNLLNVSTLCLFRKKFLLRVYFSRGNKWMHWEIEIKHVERQHQLHNSALRGKQREKFLERVLILSLITKLFRGHILQHFVGLTFLAFQWLLLHNAIRNINRVTKYHYEAVVKPIFFHSKTISIMQTSSQTWNLSNILHK